MIHTHSSSTPSLEDRGDVASFSPIIRFATANNAPEDRDLLSTFSWSLIRTWQDLVPFAGSIVVFTYDRISLDFFYGYEEQLSPSIDNIPYYPLKDSPFYFAYVRPSWHYSPEGEPGYEVLDATQSHSPSVIPALCRRSLPTDSPDLHSTTYHSDAPLWTSGYIQLFLHAREMNLRMRQVTDEELQDLRNQHELS